MRTCSLAALIPCKGAWEPVGSIVQFAPWSSDVHRTEPGLPTIQSFEPKPSSRYRSTRFRSFGGIGSGTLCQLIPSSEWSKRPASPPIHQPWGCKEQNRIGRNGSDSMVSVRNSIPSSAKKTRPDRSTRSVLPSAEIDTACRCPQGTGRGLHVRPPSMVSNRDELWWLDQSPQAIQWWCLMR